jgi:predicted  nucleic acid-binding Zn ribbon protein
LNHANLEDATKNLLREAIEKKIIGQKPMVLVGHSLGELIIKMICNDMIEDFPDISMKEYYEMLLWNIQGIFYLTPSISNVAKELESKFEKQKNHYRWKVSFTVSFHSKSLRLNLVLITLLYHLICSLVERYKPTSLLREVNNGKFQIYKKFI